MEIKRRTRVIGIFPKRASLLLMIGTSLQEQDDEWQVASDMFAVAQVGRGCNRIHGMVRDRSTSAKLTFGLFLSISAGMLLALSFVFLAAGAALGEGPDPGRSIEEGGPRALSVCKITIVWGLMRIVDLPLFRA
jgi:hypothetical protein